MTEYRKTIQVIGFDLDQTLYAKSTEIDSAIQGYIYTKIATHRNISEEEAKNLFNDRYQGGKGMGGSSTLRDLDIPNASEIIQEALEKADIAQFLKPSPEVRALLEDIKSRYQYLDLITGSNLKNTLVKLDKLNTPFDLFSHAITGDDGSKSSGDSFSMWLTIYPTLKPNSFLYIGDRPRSDYEIPKSLGIKSILVNVAKQDPDIDCPQLSSVLELRNLL